MKFRGAIAARLDAIPPWHFALLLFLVAWLPRLVFVLAAGRADLSLDEIEYHLLAKNLSEGHGFRWFFDLKSSFRPPGFPFLLAALYSITGPNYFVARIAQTVPAATLGLLTWMLGRRILPESTARRAGLIAGLYPPLIFFSVSLMSENVFIPLLVLALYLLVRLREHYRSNRESFPGFFRARARNRNRSSGSDSNQSDYDYDYEHEHEGTGTAVGRASVLPSRTCNDSVLMEVSAREDARPTDADHVETRVETTHLLAALLGLTAATAILLRPEFTYLFPALLLWLCWTSQNRIAFLKSAVIALVIVFALVAPWCVRNYHLTGRFVYLDTRTGYNLYQGYNPNATGTFDLRQAQEPIDAFIDAALKNMQLPVPLTSNQVHALLYRELMAYRDPAQLDYPLRKQFNPETAPSDVVMHDWAMTQVKQFVREHPLRALALLPVKCAYFWDLEHRIFLFAYANNFIGPLPRALLALFLILLLAPFVLLVLGSVLELAYTPKYTAAHALLLLPVAFYTLLHSLSFGEARFHYVLIPVLALLAAQGLARWAGAAPRKTSRIRHAAAWTLVALFVLIWAHGLYTARDRWAAVFATRGNTSYIDF